MDAELEQQLSSIVEQERELGASTEARQLEDVVEGQGSVDPVGQAPDAQAATPESAGPAPGEDAEDAEDADQPSGQAREDAAESGDSQQEGQLGPVLAEERSLGASTEAGQLEDVVKG